MRRARWHRRQRAPRRLQRTLFLSFGLAILATMLLSALVFAVFGGLGLSHSPRPWVRVLAFVAVGNVLWTLSGLVARRIARPLGELSRVASELGAGKLDSRVRLPRHGVSEVGELAKSFNDMASRIEAQVKNQKELLGSVSHELRTPLARLSVLLGVLSERAAEPKLVADMEREIVEMDALVGELLAVARVDAGALQKRALDVSDAVRTCLERADLSRAELAVAPDANVVHADATLLSRALMVLLDNAKKHGGPSVQVRVEREPGKVRFCVRDDGQGFEAGDLPQLFAPFVRGRGEAPDRARGFGLGLYLVRRIAEAHGGSAFAHNQADGGAMVGFSFADP